MNTHYFCPRWGSEHLSWPDFLENVKSAGYDGVEWAIGASVAQKEIKAVLGCAKTFGLTVIAQHYDTNSADFNLHRKQYLVWLEKVKPFDWARISSQTGKDYFTMEQNRELIDLAGEHVIHETHRGKFSFAAHITRAYLNLLPNLRLTLDASHWCNVAESYLEDQKETLQLAISRTDHIHIRVGYQEGPQINDPRAPEWQEALNHHLNWWDAVVKLKKELDEDLSFTMEFGPYPYMVEQPFSREPLANQWAVNKYMMDMLRERYS